MFGGSTLRQFSVEFDNREKKFSPGDQVSGSVIVDLVEAKNARGLKIRCLGECKVSWTSTREERDNDGRNHTHTVHHTGEETYIDFKYNILGSPDSDSRIDIPAGRNVYPFNFQLPPTLPSSFNHDVGSIKYSVDAAIDRPWKTDHNTSNEFFVNNPLNLNLDQRALTKVNDEKRKTLLCCCFLNRGVITAHITLPASGFVPGELIQPNISLDNQSNSTEITELKLELNQNIRFHTRSPHSSSKEVSNTYAKTKQDGPFPKKHEVTLGLLTPVVPTSSTTYCSLIQVEYFIKVTVGISGCHTNMDRTYPVLIGTIPLNPSAIADNRAMPSAPPVDTYQPTMPGDYNNYPTMNNPYSDSSKPGYAPPSNPYPPPTQGFPTPYPPSMPVPAPPSYDECMAADGMPKTTPQVGFVVP